MLSRLYTSLASKSLHNLTVIIKSKQLCISKKWDSLRNHAMTTMRSLVWLVERLYSSRDYTAKSS